MDQASNKIRYYAVTGPNAKITARLRLSCTGFDIHIGIGETRSTPDFPSQDGRKVVQADMMRRLPAPTKMSAMCDVVQHFFTTQLSGFLQFSPLSLILIRAHVAQI